MPRGLFRNPPQPQQRLPTVQPASPSAPCYFDSVIADAPIAYWRFGDGSSPATDEIGSNDGTASGNVNFAQTSALSGDADTSVAFPATPGRIAVTEHASLHTGDVLSIEYWAKRTRSSVGDEYTAVKIGSNEWAVGFGGGDYPGFTVNGQPNGFRGTTTITDTNWHHYVFTKNTTTVHVYIDGVEGTANDGTVTVSHGSPGDIWFGVNSFIGSLDEFALL